MTEALILTFRPGNSRRLRLARLLFASHDDQTDLGRFPATGDFLQELLEPGAKLLDRARGAAGGQGVEQIGGDHVHGDQAGQGRLNPLDQIGVDLLGELLGLQEALDGRLLGGSGKRLMLFLAVGSARLSSRVLRQFSSIVSSWSSICVEDRQPAGSQRLLLRAGSCSAGRSARRPGRP